jgi:hypothetical protein
MINRKAIKKIDLIQLLEKYDKEKGVFRELFGNTTGIIELKRFMNRELANKESSSLLNEEEVNKLIDVLKKRYSRIIGLNRNYRNSSDKFTNKIYVDLANLISSTDPRILSLVQIYKNDYTSNGLLLNESKGEIFITEENYALTEEEIAGHIKRTESLSYPIHGKSLEKAIPLAESDLAKLKEIKSISSEIQGVEKKFSMFKKDSAISGDRLIHFPKNKLFVTEDSFCFPIDELLKMLTAQNRFYNPYTMKDLSSQDIERLLSIPEVKDANSNAKLQQTYFASKISRATLNELVKLAEGLLNAGEITYGSRARVPRAQQGYEKFNSYYQSLDALERKAVNNYWIDGWSTVDVSDGYIKGMRSTKFEGLYQSFGESCVHSIAGSIVKMVLMLNPRATFGVSSSDAIEFIAKIRKTHNLELQKLSMFKKQEKVSVQFDGSSERLERKTRSNS